MLMPFNAHIVLASAQCTQKSSSGSIIKSRRIAGGGGEGTLCANNEQKAFFVRHGHSILKIDRGQFKNGITYFIQVPPLPSPQ